MSVGLRRFLLLCAIVMIAPAAFGQITIVNFDFGAVPVGCSSGYAYQGAVLYCSRPYGPTQNFNASPDFGWYLGLPLGSSGPPNLTLAPASPVRTLDFARRPSAGCPSIKRLVLQSLGSFVWQAVGRL